MRKRHLVLSAATVGVMALGVSRQAFAAGYASELTVSGTSVSFDLNESVSGSVPSSSAGDVTLYYNGISQDLGALAAGTQTATLSATPTTPVYVRVTTSDAPGYLAANTGPYGAGTSPAVEIDPPGLAGAPDFGNDPYGIAVNTFANSPYFGRVYLANYGANPGVGIFIEHADGSFEGVAPGTAEAAGFEAPFNAGIPYAGADGPYNLQVGSDGYLYVSDWSDGSGGIYREQEAPVVGTGASVSGGLINGENVLNGYGEPNNLGAAGNHDDVDSAVVISGSSAAGNLKVYAVDTHYGATANPEMANQMYVWNVGNTTLTPAAANNTNIANVPNGYTGAPTALMNQNATYLGLDTRFWTPASLPSIGPGDAMETFPTIPSVITNLARGGPNNQFYVSQSRSAGQQPGLFVLSPTDNTTVIWDSLDETERQQIPNTYGVDVLLGLDAVQASPDGRFLVVSQSSSADYTNPYNGSTTTTAADFGFFVMPLLAGIPDAVLAEAVTTAHGSNRQIAFDAADNVYTVNATTANEQVWGPGGVSYGTTGSNGTYVNGGSWNVDASGNLNNTANWLGGLIATGINQPLTFGAVTTAQRTVSVNTAITAGSITFSSPNGYVLANGGSTITMSGFGVNLTANAGANTISAPISVQNDIGFYAASGASLTASALSYGAQVDAVKNGPGTVSVSSLNLLAGGSTTNQTEGNLDIYQGKLQLLQNSGPAVINELTLLNQYGAALDLTNNDLVYYYNLNNYTKTSPESVVQGLVASGAIYTSTGGIAKGTGLAVAENNSTFFPQGQSVSSGAGPFTTFDGMSVTGTSSSGGTIIVKYTYFGDLNFDGKVDSADAALMGIDGTTTTMGWVGGDLNYDGKVNADDWSLFDLGAAAYAAHGAIVPTPEPAALTMLGFAAIPLLRRRRA